MLQLLIKLNAYCYRLLQYKDALHIPFSLYRLSVFEVLGPVSSSNLAPIFVSFSSLHSRLLLCLLKMGELTSA